jgi:hypothetical protein
MADPKQGELGGDYARDTHREGFGDDYARDGGWSGAGNRENYARDDDRRPIDPDATQKIVPRDSHIGKASE